MKKRKIQTGQIVLHILFLIIVLIYLVPFMLVLSVSFTDERALIQNGYRLIPSQFSLTAYKMVFQNPSQILNSYATTITFTMIATILTILVMGIMAYPMSRPNYRHNKLVTFLVLFTMLFNGGMVPTYLVITKYMHLNNTIWVYIFPGLVSAYNLIIIRTNYKSLPNELIEAAKIDGAGEMYICFRIVMPLSKAALASIGFLFFVGKWNDWNTSLLYITEPKLYSLQYLLQRILQHAEYLKQLAGTEMLMPEETFPTEGYRYAMAVVAAGPVLLIFPFFQKYFTKGLTLGGVKG